MPSLRMIRPFLNASLLLASATPGCVSDFSPEPMKGSQNVAKTPDASIEDAARPARDASTSPAPRDSGADEEDSDSPAVAPDGGDRTTASAACDLTGRWIVTERAQSAAYGAQQVTLVWLYLEISQENDRISVTRTLMCGDSTKEAPGEIFAISVDDRAAWPAYQKYINYNGRSGSARDNGTGCDVSFEPDSLIRGMTPTYYKSTDQTLPTIGEREEGASPGWADWDDDGNPGITQVISGSASGSIYSSIRVTTSSLQGAITKAASSFRLDDFKWKQERVVLGSREPDPLGILSSPAERSPGAGLNFVEFARLGADQATGSDDDICEAIRKLAPTFNPAANPQ